MQLTTLQNTPVELSLGLRTLEAWVTNLLQEQTCSQSFSNLLQEQTCKQSISTIVTVNSAFMILIILLLNQ